ncbi:hypothetical protein QDX21_07885 [Auritidibacter ignavus]|uniref:Uncharacterized protein n=1 Tax=Auritidibacter ignavus TaxID=678932 RepID=A0AAJ6DE60_9MICC|nr:hypothetical protein [Auritidibacter ignavus]WGH92248.1 hypothetical protein QDX21_07885 [Auritidibacter ignavus]WHS27079.1 hypothetical protein QM395_06585 [Auritidibacter ignavus]
MGEADDQDEHQGGGTKDYDGQHGQNQLGEGQHHVVDAHDDRVGDPTGVGGNHTQQGAEDQTDGGGGRCAQEQQEPAPHEAGEDRPAEIIGTQQRVVGERQTDEFGGGVSGDLRGEKVADQGNKQHQASEDDTDFAFGLSPDAGHEWVGFGSGGFQLAHEALLSLGLARMPTISAARFTRT